MHMPFSSQLLVCVVPSSSLLLTRETGPNDDDCRICVVFVADLWPWLCAAHID